jgi:Rrf2 family transcriptional regulator, nitric oxide-sensitive transcriptional repressor
MRLNLATDYALRVLLHLTQTRDAWTSAVRIAEAHEVSGHHVRAVCKSLTGIGWLEARRGAGGGVRLAIEPSSLSVGQVVRELEPLELVECFSSESNTCRLDPSCRLKSALRKATKAFLGALDEVTLAELSRDRALRRLVIAERQANAAQE